MLVITLRVFGGPFGSGLDRWEKAGQHKARMYIPAFGALLGVPTFFLVVIVPSFYASMFFLFIE